MPYFFARSTNARRLARRCSWPAPNSGNAAPPGAKSRKHDVQPHAVDPQGRQPLQQSVGIGIQFGIQQRVAVDRKIGIDEAKLFIVDEVRRRRPPLPPAPLPRADEGSCC